MFEELHLLVVDDDEVFCRVLQAQMESRGYRVSTLTGGSRALEFLRAHDVDLLLLDLVMPDIGGLELLAQIREHFAVLPIVVVTGHDTAEATVAAMRGGASDFITKPVESSFLDLRIRRALSHEHNKQLANTDGLTGLYNHRHLQERLEQEVQRACRYQRNLSLIMADLDGFKAYNDTFGHPRGDEVLIQVARTFRRVSRASDVVARYGGEEFTLILPETPLAEAARVAERAREAVEALRFDNPGGGPSPHVSLSLGVAALPTGGTREQLVSAADQALYLAKRQGRNRVAVDGGVAEAKGEAETGPVLVAAL